MPPDKVNIAFPAFIFVRDEDIRIMGQRGEFRGEYKLGVTAGELKQTMPLEKVIDIFGI